jgi:hypothetical protein
VESYVKASGDSSVIPPVDMIHNYSKYTKRHASTLSTHRQKIPRHHPWSVGGMPRSDSFVVPSVHLLLATASRSNHLLQTLQKQIRVPLLEDQHRPQPHRPLSASTDVNAHTLRLPQHLISPRAVPSNEGALALPSQILDLMRVARRKILKSGEQVGAGVGGVGDEVEALDFMNDGAEEEGTGRVAYS